MTTSLIVTTSYPRWPGDGAGNFVATHAAELASDGPVRVVAAGPASGWSHDPRVTVTRIPSSVFYRGGAPDLLWHGRTSAAAAQFIARLAWELARMSPTDRTIAHWLAPSAVLALPRRGELATIAHGGDVHLLDRLRLLSGTMSLLAARDASIRFVARPLRERAWTVSTRRVRAWLDRRSVVAPMAVDVAHFAGLGAPPRPTTSTPPIVLVMARLVPQKGVDVAIDAVRLVHAHQPVRLVVLGAGPERLTLERRAGAWATFCGEVTTDVRDEWLRQSHVVLVPSRAVGPRTEGTPLAALEGLAAGRPVIASAVGGLVDLPVTLVPPDDAAELAHALAAALPSFATDAL